MARQNLENFNFKTHLGFTSIVRPNNGHYLDFRNGVKRIIQDIQQTGCYFWDDHCVYFDDSWDTTLRLRITCENLATLNEFARALNVSTVDLYALPEED